MRIITIILATLTFSLSLLVGGIVVRDGLKVGAAFEKLAKIDKKYANESAREFGGAQSPSKSSTALPSAQRFRFAAYAMALGILATLAALVTLFAVKRYALHAAGAAVLLATAAYLLMPKLPSGGYEMMPDKRSLVALGLVAFGALCSLAARHLAKKREQQPSPDGANQRMAKQS